MSSLARLIPFLLCALRAASVPASPSVSATESWNTVPLVPTAAQPPLWDPAAPATPSGSGAPEPIRGSLGVPIIGPDNIPIDQENPDLFAPPETDHGFVGNAKWPFSFSHNRLQTGGWARQQNTAVMPLAENMASVNMRLEAGAIRELHWHKNAEWAYVLKGTTQVSAVDAEGRNFLGNVYPGDLWYFPAGIPHSLQATGDDPDGSEFLLVFDTGDFSEDATFLLTDWLAHVPPEVIRKNFGIQEGSDAFSHIPKEELYIFPSTPPPDGAQAPESPQGTVPDPFTFSLSQTNGTNVPGGSVKIVDSTTFKVSKTIAAAEVTVNEGAMRELHWHPTMDEWTFILQGHARITIFASQGVATTFDYQPGDIAYVPASMGHYVENIGNGTMKFLEVFNTDRFQDISLSQWLALTPPDVVKAHLHLDDETISKLSKVKQSVVAGSSGTK